MSARPPGRGALAEPLRRKAGITSRGWSPRLDRSAGDPQRYSRFVTIMKRALLLAALALIAAVIAYSLQPREQSHVAMTFERMSKVADDLAMIKPRLRGTDADGNPFFVTADEAVQVGRNEQRAKLTNVQADVTLKNNTWLSASATRGLLDINAKVLDLSGTISVYSDSGYELHTTRAHVDLGGGKISGDAVVTGHGPFGTFRADSFNIDRADRRVSLTGHVRMKFFTLHGAKKTP